jgi:hypothetical protein
MNHHKNRKGSLRLAGAIAAGAASAAIFPMLPAVGQDSPPVGHESPARVAVCHKAGTPAERTLMLPQPAVEAHVRHGDALEPCG